MKAKILILLLLVGSLEALSWPSGARPDLSAGGKPVPAGHFRLSGFGAQLTNDTWDDQRLGIRFELGVARGLALDLASGSRDVSGHGAFQNGAEDMRIGLALWPLSYKDKLSLGVSGHLLLPTGFRDGQSYYDSTTNAVVSLPAFSLEQTAGQFALGGAWTPGRAAELSGYLGYFGTSDNSEQALRWGMNFALMPFGKRIGASMGYAQSITRVGKLPDTEALRAGLDIQLPWGFALHPGIYAELESDPLMGGAVGLSFTSRMPRSVFPPRPMPKSAPLRTGAIMLPPPLAESPMAGNQELWNELREGLAPAFEYVVPLESLDRPGLPFDEMNRASFWNSMAALHAAYPNVRWLLITHVEDETVTRDRGLGIPMLVAQPKLEAACKLRVQLVDLFEQTAYPERTVLATAMMSDGVKSPLLSTIEDEKISVAQTREITLLAYRNAGREVALALPPREDGE